MVLQQTTKNKLKAWMIISGSAREVFWLLQCFLFMEKQQLHYFSRLLNACFCVRLLSNTGVLSIFCFYLLDWIYYFKLFFNCLHHPNNNNGSKSYSADLQVFTTADGKWFKLVWEPPLLLGLVSLDTMCLLNSEMTCCQHVWVFSRFHFINLLQMGKREKWRY